MGGNLTGHEDKKAENLLSENMKITKNGIISISTVSNR
jgi:hypothetical protein